MPAVQHRAGRAARRRGAGDLAVLADGSTLLLFTDGLVERRDQLFDTGVERLEAVLAELHAAPVEDVCDGVLARLVPDAAEDDVALVAVRLQS